MSLIWTTITPLTSLSLRYVPCHRSDLMKSKLKSHCLTMCIHLTLSLKSFPCPYLHPFLSLSLSLSPSLSPSVTHSLSLSLTLVSHPKCQMGTGSRALPVRTALPVRALIEHPLQGLYHPDLGSRNQNGIGSTELPGSEYMTSPREVIKAVCLSFCMPP